MEYQVERRLGRGGMGVVDLAYDRSGRPVAMKRLSLHGSAEEMSVARTRIRREAEVLGQLDHPGIVSLIDVLDDGDDVVLVMPYLAGGSLHDRVAGHGPLHPNEVMAIADQLLDALTAAHRQGIIHRDIKPANVLFDHEGRAHLVDFGVASTRDHTLGLTAVELVVGTPAFMAPEQARGEIATPAADVFSLGATLLFAATGSGPYGSPASDPRVLMHRAAAGKVERLPKDLPGEVRDRLTPMLARDPDRRPSAAHARGGPAGTWPMTGVRAAIGRHRVRAGAIVAAVLVLAVAATAGLLLEEHKGSSAVLAGPNPTAAASTSAVCRGSNYQPCVDGKLGPTAPFTDGVRCIDGHADYDGDAATGCEAEPDLVPDGSIVKGEVRANLVPDDDVDRWRLPVEDRAQLLCDGAAYVSLTAPAGVSMQLEVLDGETVLGRETSANGSKVTIAIGDPRCGSNDTTTLDVVVSWIGSDRSAENYVLSTSGSY